MLFSKMSDMGLEPRNVCFCVSILRLWLTSLRISKIVNAPVNMYLEL